MKYVLIGSLGNITKPLAAQLIASGHEVTVITSNAARQAQIENMGAKAAIGDVEDVAFLTRTFSGADAVYTMVPPKMDAPVWRTHIQNMGKTYAAAIKASGVKKVVQLSSIGAHMPAGCGPVSGIHFVEEELNALDNVDVKHLRPGYFYTNLYNNTGMIKHGGIFGNNFGADAMLVMVHPTDIAAIAAEELTNLRFSGKSFRYIAGDLKNSKEIAQIIGNAIGKPELPYVAFSDKEATDGAVQAGISPDMANNFTEMGSAIRSGEMMSDFLQHNIKPEGKIKLSDFAKEFATVYNGPEQTAH